MHRIAPKGVWLSLKSFATRRDFRHVQITYFSVHSRFAMITYNDLVDKIAQLHSGPSGVAPSYAINCQWIPSVVDSTTSNKTGEKRVLVAFGANFGTGSAKLPTSANKKHRIAAPWIEDNLGKCRGAAKKHIVMCRSGLVRRHWNGILPCNPDYNLPSDAYADIENSNFHLVMTNATPWITQFDWAKIRDGNIEDIFAILAQPGTANGMLDYFRKLKKIVGRDAVWIGHGNSEIYGLFLHYCRRLTINPWFFSSNLSQRNLFAPKNGNI
jgi:hypothetical protein